MSCCLSVPVPLPDICEPAFPLQEEKEEEASSASDFLSEDYEFDYVSGATTSNI